MTTRARTWFAVVVLAVAVLAAVCYGAVLERRRLEDEREIRETAQRIHLQLDALLETQARQREALLRLNRVLKGEAN